MLEPLAILSYLMAKPFGNPEDPRPMQVQVVHTRAHSPLPKRYTCHGKPPRPLSLRWSQVPDGTQSFVVILMDLDVPRQQSYHWAIYNLPDTATGFDTSTPAHWARNSWDKMTYQPPCPQRRAHHYRVELYALNVKLPEDPVYSALELRKALQPYLLASANRDYIATP